MHATEKELAETIPYLFGIAFRLTQDRHSAEDLVQETLTKAWLKWDTLKEPAARKSWLRRICTNCFLTEKRREAGYVPLSLEALAALDREGRLLEAADANPLPEEELVVSEAIAEMRDGCFLAMTRKLTLEQRMAFSLHDMFGMEIGEAAETIGVSVSAAKALLHRARANLDSFFAGKCSMVRVENPCRCESYLNFASERQERQEEMRSRIKRFRFGEYPEGFTPDAALRLKVRRIYERMPDRLPDPQWFSSVLQIFS